MHEYIVAFYYLHVPLFFLTVQNFHNKPKDPFLSHNPSAHSQLNHSALQQIHFFIDGGISCRQKKFLSVNSLYMGTITFMFWFLIENKQDIASEWKE